MTLSALAAALLAAVLSLFGLRPAPEVVETIADAARDHGCDEALVTALCAKESELGTARRPHLLCGAHIRLAGAAPRAWDRSTPAQVGAACGAFPRGARASYARRLAAWRCGWSARDAVCRATVGARYAAGVLRAREQLAARLRREFAATAWRRSAIPDGRPSPRP